MSKELDQKTHMLTQKAFDTLLVESQMLGEIIAEHRWRIGTGRRDSICTNNRYLYIEPEWWAKWRFKERVFLLAHGSCHIVQKAWDKNRITAKHMAEPLRTGRALDLAVNGLLSIDPKISKYLTPALVAEGWFPSKIGLDNGLSFDDYFNLIGRQEDEEGSFDTPPPSNSNDDDDDGSDDSDGSEGKEDTDNGDVLNDDSDADPWDIILDTPEEEDEPDETMNLESIYERIREQDNKLSDKIRQTIVPKEDAKCIDNWKEIMRDFIWKKAREEKTYKRPSRRWDGIGPVIPGRASRAFPKTALILDYSGSMGDYIKACAESVVRLITEISNSEEVYVVACSNMIVCEWLIQRNTPVPTTSEMLSVFSGGKTHMMPAIRSAKAWGAELMFCVSDMQTYRDDIECDEVHWITEYKNNYIQKWKSQTGFPKKHVFDVLLVNQKRKETKL